MEKIKIIISERDLKPFKFLEKGQDRESTNNRIGVNIGQVFADNPNLETISATWSVSSSSATLTTNDGNQYIRAGYDPYRPTEDIEDSVIVVGRHNNSTTDLDDLRGQPMTMEEAFTNGVEQTLSATDYAEHLGISLDEVPPEVRDNIELEMRRSQERGEFELLEYQVWMNRLGLASITDSQVYYNLPRNLGMGESNAQYIADAVINPISTELSTNIEDAATTLENLRRELGEQTGVNINSIGWTIRDNTNIPLPPP